MNDIIVDVIKDTGNQITVSQNDNLTKTYKLIVTKNNARYDLSNKKVRFAFLKNGTNLGDIVEELNISDATNGVVDLPITSTITRENGVFTCGLAIFNDSGYMENTAFFNMIVKESLFEKISGGLIDEGAYGQILSLLEKGEKLQKQLEPLVDRAEIATSKLEDLVPRAERITEPLQKAVEDAEVKKPQLDASIESARKFIENLDKSQNLPQIRMDVDALQNGLKSNQELSYEGQSLKCENTLDGRIEDIVLEGMTYQNLFKKDFVGNETSTSNCDGIVIGNGLNLKPNTTYTIIYEIKSSNNINIVSRSTMFRIDLRSSIGETIPYGFEGDLTTSYKYVTGKFTTGNDIIYCKCNLRNAFTGVGLSSNTLTIKNIIILEGDYTNKYIPSYFEGIESVGEAEENKINALSCGKNLLKPVAKYIKVNLGGVNAEFKSDGTIVMNGTATGNGGRTAIKGVCPRIHIMQGKSYKLSFKQIRGNYTSEKPPIFAFSKEDDSAYLLTYTNATNSILVDEDIDLYYGINVVKGDVYNNYTFKVQLEQNTKHTDYEDYKQHKRELKLPFEGGLKGLPNGAKDLIYNKENGCYVRKNIEKTIFNGNIHESWYNANVETEEYITFYTPMKLGGINGYSNLFTNNPSIINNTYIGEGFYPSTQYNVIYFKIKKSKLESQDVTGFKKWLQTNPITVYYELAEPVETKISDTKLSLDTYNTLTYAFSNNAISPNIKLKVASNLGSIIQQNAKSINDIYKLIDEVLIPQIATNTADIAVLKLK